MLVLTSVLVRSTSGAVAVTSTVSLTAPGTSEKFCVVVLPIGRARSFASALENPGAVTLTVYVPAESASKRYSPVSFVLVLRLVPVSLLVIVTSALLPSTACDLSVTVPCRVALAVLWPNRLAVLSSTKQLMTATHNHRLLFILLSPWNLGIFSTFSPRAFVAVFLKKH